MEVAVNIKEPLLQGVPHLVFNKLVERDDFNHFVNVAWECESPNQASLLCSEHPEKFFLKDIPSRKRIEGGSGFNRVAQEVRKLRRDKIHWAPQAKEALLGLIQEIRQRRNR